MKNNYIVLLYLFIIALVVAGLSLLFLRQPFVDIVRVKTGITSIEVAPKKFSPASSLIDTEILKDEHLTALNNSVKVFVFEEICGESVNSPKRCVKGNNNPFLKK